MKRDYMRYSKEYVRYSSGNSSLVEVEFNNANRYHGLDLDVLHDEYIESRVKRTIEPSNRRLLLVKL